MGFIEFLEKAGLTQAEFQKLSPMEQDYFHASYKSSLSNASKAEEREQREEEQKKDLQKSEKEKIAQQQEQAFYDKWNTHFNNYAGNLGHKGFEKLVEGAAKRQSELTEERKKAALNVARMSCKNDPEKLLFAEADALDANLKLESWTRMVPNRDDFISTFDYAKHQSKEGKTLSETMKALNPKNVDYAMYSHLVKRYDKDDKFRALKGEDAFSKILSSNSEASKKFYEDHKDDEKPFANAENLDFTMKEMFRLEERMSRNSRMTGPMKELCTKIKALKKDYTANPDKYKDMPRGRLNNMMQSIGFAADAYIDAKKDQKSFSSTQLERLKCINQLKTLQDAFMSNANKKELAYTADSNHMDTAHAYLLRAVAEKMVMAGMVQTKNGALMCNRTNMSDRVDNLLEDPEFSKFKQKIINDVTAKEGPKSNDYIYKKMLKTNGQKLIKSFNKFCNDASKEQENNMGKKMKDDRKIKNDKNMKNDKKIKNDKKPPVKKSEPLMKK